MDKYDDTYNAVMYMAKCKMIMNQHKGNIEDNSSDDLINMAKAELFELKDAIKAGDHTHIIEEVADILNFAIAAAHQAIDGYRGRKNPLSEVVIVKPEERVLHP